MSLQGKFWLLTIPHYAFLPYLPKTCSYIKGQLECGRIGEYLHWQILCCFEKKVRLRRVKEVFGDTCHAELSRSSAANQYVQKEDTAVVNTRFELGQLPFKRNDKTDWERIRICAKSNQLDQIDADVYVRYYSSLKRIAKDHMCSVDELDNVCGLWIWGPPGTGKSRMARDDYNPYSKMCNKWWDGYNGEENVLLDDFDKVHSVLGHHLKIWADRYPFIAEQKGGAVRIRPKKIIITSNYQIDEIFVDQVLVVALLRRFQVINKV